VGSYHSCWYDSRNPAIAQWNKPSTQVAIILLSCGGLLTLLAIALSILTYLFVKEQKHDGAQNYFTHTHI
ncbi:unnamed protein product, partial [Rotaria sp. Silwood2]